MQQIVAELVVQDVDASILWYRGLGFEVDGEGIRDEDGLQWVSLTRSGRQWWLRRTALSPGGAKGAPSVRLYLEVATVHTFYERPTAQQVAVKSSPETQSYGLREMSVRHRAGSHS